LTDGIYLPADDRRHYVGWSDRTKDDECFQDYWNKLWSWYKEGGIWHVAAYLKERDIIKFDPKAPPPKTAAFWEIVDAGQAPEEAEITDVLDALGNPNVVTIEQLVAKAWGELGTWLEDRHNRRAIPHRLARCGLVPVRNPEAEDGLWKIDGRRRRVYAKKTLSKQDQIKEARSVRSVKSVVAHPDHPPPTWQEVPF
jgi:hypothetical protein